VVFGKKACKVQSQRTTKLTENNLYQSQQSTFGASCCGGSDNGNQT
jgi:hypothetical protein